MKLTAEQIAMIRKKEAELPDALKRDPLANYREGYFHVTLNTRGNVPVLGWITGRVGEPPGSKDTPHIVLSELGKKVQEVWERTPSIYPEVENIAFQIMPQHIHILWHLNPGNKRHLGQVVGGFMAGSSHGYWDTLGIDWQNIQPDARALKGWQRKGPEADRDRYHTRSNRGPALFVRGYNDMEAVDDNEVQTKIKYIQDNPERWLLRKMEPQVFRVHRDMRSANWTPLAVLHGLCADRYIAADRNRQTEAWRQLTTPGLRNDRGRTCATLKIQKDTAPQPSAAANTSSLSVTQPGSNGTVPSPHPSHTPRLVLDLVGNMGLLQRPLFPLVCHRADAGRFDEQAAAVMRAAREQGGVIVTACVSPKERAIVKQLHQQLLPVIEVVGYGFSERYKPAGKAFYAVAEGRRLEVSPWQYEFRRREMRPVLGAHGAPVLNPKGEIEMEEEPDITREMCMVMNELVRIIARKPDDWWKRA